MWRHFGPGVLRAFTRFHRFVYVHSRGWIGHHLTGRLPSLLLHTTGRRSGQTRTVTLVYAESDGGYVVAGTNFGGPRPPAWLENLRADPRASVHVGRHRHQVTASIHEPGSAEYERLLPAADRATGQIFPRYRLTATRPIPVVHLMPSR